MVQRAHIRLARALPSTKAFALAGRGSRAALPGLSLPSVAGPGLQALPPAEVVGWPSAILPPLTLWQLSISCHGMLYTSFSDEGSCFTNRAGNISLPDKSTNQQTRSVHHSQYRIISRRLCIRLGTTSACDVPSVFQHRLSFYSP